MRPLISALVCLAVGGYFAACGSSGDDSKNGNGTGGAAASGTGAKSGSGGGSGDGSAAASGSGGTAAGGSGGSAASGASGATDGGLLDVTFTYDGPVEDVTFTEDSSCANTVVKADPLPLDMYVILDKSGSMNDPLSNGDCNVGASTASKWCFAVNSLYSFFSAPTSAGMGVALSFFSGNGCPNLNTAQVAMNTLPTHLPALQTALNGAVPSGNTPTSAAATGIATYTAANQVPGRKMIGVLITDGDPTTCNTSVSAINTILVNHFNATQIPTYIIGMTGATFSNLQAIAVNAGAPSHTTYCGGGISPCHFYNVANGDPTTFVAVLQTIQQTAIGCQYTIPTTDAGLIDPDKVIVTYTPGSGGPPQPLTRVNDATQCGPGGGWHYDNNTTPSLIILCPATCTTVQADTSGQVNISLGCLGS